MADQLLALELDLLDLPTDLLHHVLRHVPDARSLLRCTCHRFREVADDACQELRVRPQGKTLGFTLVARGRGPPPPLGQGQLKDLAALLRRLPALQSLSSTTHNFRTLPFLAACPNLTSLELTDCNVAPSKLAALASCRKLTSLELGWCHKLTHIRPLAALTSLSSLCLSNCRSVASLTPLAHCSKLTSLDVTGCRKVTSLCSLTALPALSSLSISNNVSLAPLAACPALAKLSLHGWSRKFGWLARWHVKTPFDLAPLAACASLHTLRLGCDATSGLGPLASLSSSLTCLDLTHCEAVVDIGPLASCTALTHLDITSTGVTSVLALRACSSLSILAVDQHAYSLVTAEEVDQLKAASGPRLRLAKGTWRCGEAGEGEDWSAVFSRIRLKQDGR